MAQNNETKFRLAQDGEPPTPHQLTIQRGVRGLIADTAQYLEDMTDPSREQSLALTKLEEALMWAGKAIFKP